MTREPLARGTYPLELSATCIERERLATDEADMLRAGQIPDPLLAHLRTSRLSRLGAVVAAWINVVVFVGALGPWGLGGELRGVGQWSCPAVILGVFIGIAVLVTQRWLRLRRDLRERRLGVEEGELTAKWTKTEEDEIGTKHVTRRARIGRRTVEIRSHDLFSGLGSGVRYRLFVSKYARQLVAIEGIEPRSDLAGYRTAPVRHEGDTPHLDR